jgi:hypothetical protein
MPEDMGRGAVEGLENPGDIGRKVVEGDALQWSLTAPYAAHIDRNNLQPGGSEARPEIIKITGATPRIRKQNERVSCSV